MFVQKPFGFLRYVVSAVSLDPGPVVSCPGQLASDFLCGN
jgi:hypothetical protein